MNAESQVVLHEIEVAFFCANQMNKICKSDAIKKVNRLKDLYHNEKNEIENSFRDLCERYNVDLFSEIRISDKDINNFIENNVPLAEPQNE